MKHDEIMTSSFREAGIPAFGFLPRDRLLAACSGLEPELSARLSLEESGGALVAALPYGEGSSFSPPWAEAYPGPIALLARFARAHWYGELLARLRAAASILRSSLGEGGHDPGPPKAWRYFSNSRLPERALALEAGLGSRGRHGLLMLPEPGSAVVLGLILCPRCAEAPLSGLARDGGEAAKGPQLDGDCAHCGACVAACPTGALDGEGGLRRELCIQHWSSIPGPLPPLVEAAWGRRLYGCDACQEACPRYRPDASALASRGILGRGLPVSWLISSSEEDIRAKLRGSVLGMKWIAVDALKRNAALARDNLAELLI